MNNKELADIIFKHYYDVYGGEVQGCCPVIADDIQKAIGGEIVLGYLHFATTKRSHWWVEKEGVVYDPMGDEYSNEPCFRREEIHRDNMEILKILPCYEQYRLI